MGAIRQAVLIGSSSRRSLRGAARCNRLLRMPSDPLALIRLFASNLLLYVVARVLLTGILVKLRREVPGAMRRTLPGRTRGLGREFALIPACYSYCRWTTGAHSCHVACGSSCHCGGSYCKGQLPPFTTTLDIAQLLGRGLLIILLACCWARGLCWHRRP